MFENKNPSSGTGIIAKLAFCLGLCSRTPSRKHTKQKTKRCHRRKGFTLIEAALTTVIVGTGVLAIVSAQQSYLMKNNWAQRTGEAVLLANELRELTMALPLHDPITQTANLGPEVGETGANLYNDVDDFAGTVTNGQGTGIVFMDADEIAALNLTAPQYQPGPINALRQVIPDMKGWRQEIKVQCIPPEYISTTIPQALGSTKLMRVTVTIKYKNPSAPADEAPIVVTDLTWLVGK